MRTDVTGPTGLPRDVSRDRVTLFDRARPVLALSVMLLIVPLAAARQALAVTSKLGPPLAVNAHGGPAQFAGDEQDMGVETPLSPVLPNASSMLLTPDAETPGGGQWTCNDPWDPVANEAGGVMIGNCMSGTVENRTVYSGYDATIGGYFFGGYVSGSYGGCGWLRSPETTWVPNSKTYTGCSTPDTLYGQVGAFYNSSSYHFGTAWTTTNTCTVYANAHPWLSTPVIADPIPTALPGGTTVYWRYATGQAGGGPSIDGVYHDYWIAIETSAQSNGFPMGWVFAPYHACFGTTTPPPGPGNDWIPPAGV
jgi:hypothetical protein